MHLGRPLTLLVVAVAVTGCRLLTLGVPCEGDANCRGNERCVEQLCVRTALLPGPDGGGVVDEEDDAGPPPRVCPDPDADPAARLVLTEPLLVDSAAALAALEGVVVIDGDVSFLGAEGFSQAHLPDLVEVTGGLHVDPLPDLTPPLVHVSLPCLHRVGAALILDGDAAASFDLPRLEEVGGRLVIEDGFPDFELPALARVAANVRVHEVLATDLSGLSALREARVLEVLQNTELLSLTGLEGVTTLLGQLRVRQNPKLTTLAALSGLVQVGGGLFLQNNATLPECEAEALRERLVANGFRQAAIVAGNDELAGCPQLALLPCPPVFGTPVCPDPAPNLTLASPEDVAAAADLTCVGDLLVSAGVTDVCLPALAEITGSLQLLDGNTATRIDLPALKSLGSLYGSGPALTTLELPRVQTTSVELFDMPVLERVYLPRLATVGGAFRLRDLTTSLLYLPQLGDVAGELEVLRIESVTALGFPLLEDVDGILRVRGMPALISLGGLQALREVTGMEIVSNTALQNFDGIGLRTIVADVLIDQNPALTSVDGIPRDAAFSGNLITVTNNACLPEADAIAWAEALSPGANVVTGNGTGECP